MKVRGPPGYPDKECAQSFSYRKTSSSNASSSGMKRHLETAHHIFLGKSDSEAATGMTQPRINQLGKWSAASANTGAVVVHQSLKEEDFGHSWISGFLNFRVSPGQQL